MRSTLLAVLLTLPLSSAFASPEVFRPWSGNSRPETMDDNFQKNFSALPLEGNQVNVHRLWSSDYWPLYKGNINYRWNAPRPTGFRLKSPTKEQALQMNSDQIAQLAPSEKWDLLRGHYDYPLVKDVSRHTSPDIPIWQGICNGWAPAALNHDEPMPKTLTNPDGINVPFGSSDIKALLSYYYAYLYDAPYTHQMGYRCDEELFGDACKNDLNAGAFHIVLANRVGLEGTSFIADVERKAEVWNHPIPHYKTRVIDAFVRPKRSSAPGTVRMARVKTDMDYVYEIKKNDWEPVLGTDKQVIRTKHYEYFLDLDASGNIIGGDWISGDRPDFLWTMPPVEKFSGLLEGLDVLL